MVAISTKTLNVRLGLRINNARRTVLARVSGLVYLSRDLISFSLFWSDDLFILSCHVILSSPSASALFFLAASVMQIQALFEPKLTRIYICSCLFLSQIALI